MIYDVLCNHQIFRLLLKSKIVNQYSILNWIINILLYGQTLINKNSEIKFFIDSIHKSHSSK